MAHGFIPHHHFEPIVSRISLDTLHTHHPTDDHYHHHHNHPSDEHAHHPEPSSHSHPISGSDTPSLTVGSLGKQFNIRYLTGTFSQPAGTAFQICNWCEVSNSEYHVVAFDLPPTEATDWKDLRAPPAKVI